jgi:hypothetical protein
MNPETSSSLESDIALRRARVCALAAPACAARQGRRRLRRPVRSPPARRGPARAPHAPCPGGASGPQPAAGPGPLSRSPASSTGELRRRGGGLVGASARQFGQDSVKRSWAWSAGTQRARAGPCDGPVQIAAAPAPGAQRPVSAQWRPTARSRRGFSSATAPAGAARAPANMRAAGSRRKSAVALTAGRAGASGLPCERHWLATVPWEQVSGAVGPRAHRGPSPAGSGGGSGGRRRVTTERRARASGLACGAAAPGRLGFCRRAAWLCWQACCSLLLP